MYIPLIEEDLDEHMQSMRRRKKRRSTLNPKFPKGTHRPCELMLRKSHGIPVSKANLRLFDEAAFRYWGKRAEATSPWEQDPLKTQAARDLRARVYEPMHFANPKARYRALRQLNRDIMGMPINQTGA